MIPQVGQPVLEDGERIIETLLQLVPKVRKVGLFRIDGLIEASAQFGLDIEETLLPERPRFRDGELCTLLLLRARLL